MGVLARAPLRSKNIVSFNAVEIEEHCFVQQLVAHSSVEALDEAILHRVAKCDEVPHPARCR